MSNICRIGDINNGRGAIIDGASTVFANGLLLGLQGSSLSPHVGGGPHKKAIVSYGSPTVYADGRPVARVTSGNSCGHSMTQGSPDVFAE